MTRLMLACSAIFFCLALAAQTTTAEPETTAALQAINYVRGVQNTDGGFPDFGTSSTPSGTIEAVLALSAAGIDPRTVERDGKSPDEFLATQAAAYVAVPGSAAKLVVGLAAMDIDPTAFGGVDALAAMEANYDSATGKYGDDVFAQALYMLAEKALGRPVPAASSAFLISLQKADGGWEYCCGFGTDTNTTAIAMRALIAADVPSSDPSLVSALAFLKANQTANGGFRYSAPFDADASSTAYGIQAIIAAGQSVEAGGPWDLSAGANPLAALLSFQNPATGALQAYGDDNTFATYQAVPGMMLAAFPEQAEPDDYAPTATATTTPTATTTATRTATPTITQTASPTRTNTPTRTATIVTGVSTAPTFVPTAVSTVLGSSVRPPSAGVVASLPRTGTGAESSNSSRMSISFTLVGAFLAAAGGIIAIRKRAV